MPGVCGGDSMSGGMRVRGDVGAEALQIAGQPFQSPPLKSGFKICMLEMYW